MKLSVLFQRTEAACLSVVAVYGYHLLHGSWILFVILWFSFDLTMLGYAVSKRIGAIIYNLGHSFILPALLAVIALEGRYDGLELFILVWTVHITLDRAFGYGLKETTDFAHTHLGLIGPAKRETVRHHA